MKPTRRARACVRGTARTAPCVRACVAGCMVSFASPRARCTPTPHAVPTAQAPLDSSWHPWRKAKGSRLRLAPRRLVRQRIISRDRPSRSAAELYGERDYYSALGSQHEWCLCDCTYRLRNEDCSLRKKRPLLHRIRMCSYLPTSARYLASPVRRAIITHGRRSIRFRLLARTYDAPPMRALGTCR